MKVKLALNIGRPDAHRLGIVDPSDGAIVTVDDKAGSELIGRGWAVEYRSPQVIQAIPPTPMHAVPDVDIEATDDEPQDDDESDDEPEPLPTTNDLTLPPRRDRGRPRKDSSR